MVTHLQETYKIQNKVICSSTTYHNFFKVDKLRFLLGVSISNSQKLIEWIYREEKDIVDLKSTMNQFNIIKIDTVFTQQ